MKNDYYNGINLAFLLNVRAARAAGARYLPGFPGKLLENSPLHKIDALE
ncbi:MAG: hypothetical protein M3Z23_08780 [Acidobacteriota bacterium]|nr:hypothetical protein [Acidobacteriota bacterium]